jgi:putative endonuclease
VGDKQYWLYMVTNRWKNVLYTGMTNDLPKRVWQHKNKAVPGFTKKYNCDRLVYFEEFGEVDQLIARENQVKGWKRVRKNALVEAMNPDWIDLAADWFDDSAKGVLRFAQDDTEDGV